MRIKNTTKGLLLTGALLLLSSFLVLQDPLEVITKALARYKVLFPQEKIYLHLDKPYYLSGENIYFKGYVLDTQDGSLTSGFSIVYITLTGEQGELQTLKFLAKDGLVQGQLSLPSSLQGGHYRLSAYTSTMRNLEAGLTFSTPLQVYNVKDPKPLPIAAAEKVQLSFHPEGGHFVVGLVSKVGVKAMGAAGQPGAVSGHIISSENKEVATFTTDSSGLATFMLLPAPGERYKAVAAGREWELPVPQEAGTTLQVISQPDRFQVIVRSTLPRKEELLLVAQARGSVQFYAKGTAKGFVANIPKGKLPAGLNQLVLFNRQSQPVSQRLVYVEQPEEKVVRLQLNTNQTQPRQKVSATLSTVLPVGEIAYLSMSVTKRQGHSNEGISEMALMNEFEKNWPVAAGAIDDLLLTEKWRRYNWQFIYDSLALPRFAQENTLVISGRLTDPANAPVRNERISVSIPGQTMSYEGTTDQEGYLQLPVFEYYGNEYLILQPLNNPSLINKLTFTPYQHTAANSSLPATVSGGTLDKEVQVQVENRRILKAYATANKPQDNAGSAASNSIDTLSLKQFYSHEVILKEFVSFATMREVIREIVPAAYVQLGKEDIRVFSSEREAHFDGLPLLIVDGVPTYDTKAVLALSPVDVQTIGVISQAQHLANFGVAGKYGILVINTRLYANAHTFNDKHIVLNSGLVAPQAMAAPDHSNKRIPDFRPVLHWAPMISVTPGNTTVVEFTTSDEAGEFEVVVQGMTRSGTPVYLKEVIVNRPLN